MAHTATLPRYGGAMTLTDAGAIGGPVVALLALVHGEYQRRLAGRARTRTATLEGESKAKETEAQRLMAERKELAEENKGLRVDLRAEIERMKLDAAADRAEINSLKVKLATAEARATAAEVLAASWQQKYEAEIATNVPREMELKSLRDEVARLTQRLDRMPGATGQGI